MCTGACLLYGIKRVVMGENRTFVGGEDWLRAKGVEVVNLDEPEGRKLMEEFIKTKPEIWSDSPLFTINISEYDCEPFLTQLIGMRILENEIHHFGAMLFTNWLYLFPEICC
jgi:hypothetical protein